MLRVLDLFSGIGGWTLAAHACGIETVAACEIDAWKRAHYAAHFPGVRLYRDVTKLTAKRLDKDGCGAVDLVLGSPPCQDASAANHRGRGIDGAETRLVFEAVRIIDEVRPHWACLENSPRLRTRGVDRVLGKLEACGYACWPLVVGAIHAGAPHLRQAHSGWRDGPASLARHLRVGDGISSTLAADCRSAFGDAIVPQVGTAILKAIIAAEAAVKRALNLPEQQKSGEAA
jgi:hypothetical protein